MARSQKRQRAHDSLQDIPPAKRTKSTGGLRSASNFSPAFWDNLSKVWLTPRALREFDRRNNTQDPHTQSATPSSAVSTDLARFARHGGPDLCRLRGCPDPHRVTRTLASTPPSAASQSRRTGSTKATAVSSKARRSSAYDDDFDQHLLDHNIYPEGYEFPDDRSTPEPGDADRHRQELLAARASLSPSRFSESAFRTFKRKNKTKSGGTVMRNVIPILAGDANIPNEGHLPFTNLESLTDEATVKAVPDFFDGARSGSVNKPVSTALGRMIVPTKHTDALVLPNFFLEAKAPKGGADVVLRQACYDGAYGARAMHSLQNYGETEPAYDGNAYTYSSTYHDGTLKLYTHHFTAPAVVGGRPEYHMTKLRGFDVTDTRESFTQGATVFRNARDFAKQHRDDLIKTANARSSQPAAITEQVTERFGDDVPASGEVAGSVTERTVANTSEESFAISPYLSVEDDSQDRGGPSTGASQMRVEHAYREHT